MKVNVIERKLTFREVFRTTSSFNYSSSLVYLCMIFNQPKIETVPTIDICWFTSEIWDFFTKIVPPLWSIIYGLRHKYSDRSKIVQKCIFELNVFICQLTSFEGFESDEKNNRYKISANLLLLYYKLKHTAHCAFKIYWSVDNSLQLDKNELSSTKIEFFFPLEFVWKSSWIFDGRQ